MQLVIKTNATVRCVYDEALDLNQIGVVSISRGSHVEPDTLGEWWADLAPVQGPRLGPFRSRSQALTAERDWLQRFWLTNAGPAD